MPSGKLPPESPQKESAPPTPDAAEVTEATQDVTPEPTRLEQALSKVRKNAYWAAGLGAVPIPGLDLAGIAGAQVKMINDLSNLYEVKFAEHKVKNIIGVLIGSLGVTTLTIAPIASLLKAIPGIGTIAGNLTLPLIAAGSSYALGKVFIMHFESGGTILDFDPEKTKGYFQSQFEEGKKVVAGLAK